ncbi:ImuA family protein [Allosphingosinicella vermicomposti]|uniref:ImuA family protein n=1 Tax=Allosphingosinicella vermicomposti TaxID=614671 RepID=UPI003CCA349F
MALCCPSSPRPDPGSLLPACFGLGCDGIDQRLGGLPRGRLHETIGRQAEDVAAASAFSLLLAWRALERSKPLLWIRHDKGERRSGRLDPHGLAALGIDPARLLIAHAGEEKVALQAGLDAVRCAGLGAVLIEIWGKPPVLDLTATRKLGLAAEHSGVTVFLTRIEAQAQPSAAHTRWEVTAAPSAPFPADAPGFPAFALTLLRDRRGVPGFSVNLEWDCDTGSFREPPLPRGLVPLPARRPAAAGRTLARAA